MTTEYSERVVLLFKKSVLAEYDLEEEVVASLCNKVKATLKKINLPPSRRQRGKNRQRRRKSAYNLFVREMMKDEKIKEHDHRDKMAAIGQRWKLIKPDEKTRFQTMADKENQAEVDALEKKTADEAEVATEVATEEVTSEEVTSKEVTSEEVTSEETVAKETDDA